MDMVRGYEQGKRRIPLTFIKKQEARSYHGCELLN